MVLEHGLPHDWTLTDYFVAAFALLAFYAGSYLALAVIIILAFFLTVFLSVFYWLSLPFTFIPMVIFGSGLVGCPTDENPYYLDYLQRPPRASSLLCFESGGLVRFLKDSSKR